MAEDYFNQSIVQNTMADRMPFEAELYHVNPNHLNCLSCLKATDTQELFWKRIAQLIGQPDYLFKWKISAEEGVDESTTRRYEVKRLCLQTQGSPSGKDPTIHMLEIRTTCKTKTQMSYAYLQDCILSALFIKIIIDPEILQTDLIRGILNIANHIMGEEMHKIAITMTNNKYSWLGEFPDPTTLIQRVEGATARVYTRKEILESMKARTLLGRHIPAPGLRVRIPSPGHTPPPGTPVPRDQEQEEEL